jgi:hypothetical protein
MLAIIHAVEKWSPYLIRRHFKVKTNHDSLKYFLEKQLSLEEQKKWVTKMLGYDFEIIYKKVKHNVVVDALSRKEEEIEGSLCVISSLQSDWVKEARIEWNQDQGVCKIIQKLHEDSSSTETFVWKNYFLWYHDHLYLCNNSQLKQKILQELHTSPTGGHSRFLKTHHRVKSDFFGEGLKNDVQNFVSECLF